MREPPRISRKSLPFLGSENPAMTKVLGNEIRGRHGFFMEKSSQEKFE